MGKGLARYDEHNQRMRSGPFLKIDDVRGVLRHKAQYAEASAESGASQYAKGRRDAIEALGDAILGDGWR